MSMLELNSRFATQAKQFRLTKVKSLGQILVFCNDSLHVVSSVTDKETEGDMKEEYQEERVFGPLNLTRYNILKSLAHGLIYYSLKHARLYKRMQDLCETLQHLYLTPETENYFDWSVEELMSTATQEYLSELHRVAQKTKREIFGGTWPDNLLIVVAGPSSPRIGHPAMQYFSRLTGTPLESRLACARFSTDAKVLNKCQSVQTSGNEDDKKKHRRLFYAENAHSVQETAQIGLTLLVEEEIYSRFYSMATDILSEDARCVLEKRCSDNNTAK